MTFVIRVILPFITVSWAITVDAKGQHSLCRIIKGQMSRCLAQKVTEPTLVGLPSIFFAHGSATLSCWVPREKWPFWRLPPVVDKAKDHILDGSWLHPVKHISQISRTSLVHSHILQLAIAKIKRQQQPKKTAAWTHSALDEVQSLRPSKSHRIHVCYIW